MKTLDLKQAADFLNVSENTAQELAASGEIPGAKVGRAWVFHIDMLEEWLMNEITRQTQQRNEPVEIPKVTFHTPAMPEPIKKRSGGSRRRKPVTPVPDSFTTSSQQ